MTDTNHTMADEYIKILINVLCVLRAEGLTKEQALNKVRSHLDNEMIRSLDEDVANRVYEMPIEMLE